jgi:membrane protease YdiL (CAAX protease family)
MKKALIFTSLLEILYLALSFALANKYGQWSYEGEIIRTGLRIASILGLTYFYKTYFYKANKPFKPKEKLTPSFLASIAMLFLFAIAFTNAENESLIWQLVFALSGIAAGFREELFYRGIIQNSLQTKYHYRTVLLLSCAVFTLSHVQYIYHGQTTAIMLISLAGLIFGSIFIYTKSIVFVGAVHGLYDALLSINISPVRLSNAAGLPIMLLITLLFLIIVSKKSVADEQSDRADSGHDDNLSTQ